MKFNQSLLYNYQYDQLNRLTAMDVYKGLNNATNVFTPVGISDYKERISYDPNGNIKTYQRNGDAARSGMDNLTYYYISNTNQLDKVTDAAPDAAAGEYDKYKDIKQGQLNSNYQYDAIGNLTSDASEGISNIDWNVYGKIKSITKGSGTITYTYDAAGNRISKTANGKTTWYVRDATGNIMSIYEKGDTLKQKEINLYGSSRLGIYNVDVDVQTCNAVSPEVVTFTRGNKFFELTNHLGNVLVTVSDKKLQHTTDGTSIDHYDADVITAQDYYPFGMIMPGRKYSIANTQYRYGFNGKENDNEVKGEGAQYDYGFRIYDPRLGRFLSVDPLTIAYPYYTPYQYAGNKPIWCIDLDGLEETMPQQTKKVPVLTNVSESTCIGCTQSAMQAKMIEAKLHTEKLRGEYKAWSSNPENLGKPLPPQYEKVAPQATNTATIKQGGYLGSSEYKIVKARYDLYGKYLPGLSDFEDLASFANAVDEGKVDEATIFAVGFIIPEVSGKMLKGPLHHIFTNKNFIRGQQWSTKFEPLFEKAGHKLDDAINKIEVIGHKGPHPEEYHQAIFDRLQSATKGLEGSEYKRAFENTLDILKKEVSTAGTELNKLVTKQ